MNSGNRCLRQLWLIANTDPAIFNDIFWKGSEKNMSLELIPWLESQHENGSTSSTFHAKKALHFSPTLVWPYLSSPMMPLWSHYCISCDQLPQQVIYQFLGFHSIWHCRVLTTPQVVISWRWLWIACPFYERVCQGCVVANCPPSILLWADSHRVGCVASSFCFSCQLLVKGAGNLHLCC